MLWNHKTRGCSSSQLEMDKQVMLVSFSRKWVGCTLLWWRLSVLCLMWKLPLQHPGNADVCRIINVSVHNIMTPYSPCLPKQKLVTSADVCLLMKMFCLLLYNSCFVCMEQSQCIQRLQQSLCGVTYSTSCVFVSVLSSCSSIIDQPDYNQPPGFGGAAQVQRRDLFI